MSDSTNLGLPYIEAAQAQKHVTHNEALRALDAIVQLSVLDRDLAEPPDEPANGDRYLVAEGAQDEWAGQDGRIAAWQDGAWAFHVPRTGWLCWAADEELLLAWDGEAWVETTGGGGGPVNQLSVNGAETDETDRFAVSSPAALFDHEGAGHQLKINKDAPEDTASLLFQTDYEGRAEMGLAGDDDYHFKVSADGESWSEAIVIDKDTGEVSFPNTSLSGGEGSFLGAVAAGDFLRALRIRVSDGTNPDTIAVQTSNLYGHSAGPISEVDNIGKGATVSGISLSAGGEMVEIDATLLEDPVVGSFLGQITLNESTTRLVCIAGNAGGNLRAFFRDEDLADVDLTSLVDTGNRIDGRVIYVTRPEE